MIQFFSEVWGYADNEVGEDGWMGMHATRQEAIDAGRAYFESDQKDPSDVIDAFWIVRGRKPSPADFVPDVKQILDWMLERASDEHASDNGLDWPRITEDAKHEMSAFLRSWAVKHAPITFWTPDGSPERVEMKPSATERRDPIPLTAPDGRIFAYACSVCLKVGTAGEMVGVPESGEEQAEEDRRMLVEQSRIRASSCCVCRDCGVTERGVLSSCTACSASEAIRFAALLEKRIASWVAGEAAPWWPVTIVRWRDGSGYAAFPLERDEVPEDVMERVMAHEWLIANEAAPFGRGPSPEEALDDLRNRAAAILRASIARPDEAAEDNDVRM